MVKKCGREMSREKVTVVRTQIHMYEFIHTHSYICIYTYVYIVF